MQGRGGPERRKHRRAGIRMEAVLEGPTPAENVHLEVLNFSAGGFFCKMSRGMEPLTRLGITFRFPPYAEHPPRTIETEAIVIRSEGPDAAGGTYRVGACFLTLSPEDREHIEGYVSWYHLVYGETEGAK
jgi:c-di-GMP-binding flagellar brake protein YcgR